MLQFVFISILKRTLNAKFCYKWDKNEKVIKFPPHPAEFVFLTISYDSNGIHVKPRDTFMLTHTPERVQN